MKIEGYIENYGINGRSPVLLPLNLSFFSDASGEKTEPASPRKKEKAREQGQVLKSQEVAIAALFLSVFLGLRIFAPYIYSSLLSVLTFNFSMLSDVDSVYNMNFITGYINQNFLQVVLISLPIFAISMAAGIIVNVAQVGWHPTTKPLSPKMNRFNPIQGVKRLFSMRTLLELVKSVLKLAVIVAAIYLIVVNEANVLPRFLYMDLFQGFAYIGNVCLDVGVTVGGLYVFIALLDYLYQWWKHTKELKMTKQEVKEEYKQTEGNPQIKGFIRQRMREVSMRRMMAQVPTADVVITNPTHYAVALKYDREKAEAPLVVAKGADLMARRIREKALESNIHIMENKPLARALYDTVDVGREIPPELYQAVAEIFAYLVNVKKIAV